VDALCIDSKLLWRCIGRIVAELIDMFGGLLPWQDLIVTLDMLCVVM
jgi:hypothetical protein